jgi:CRP-like cAMP-binding protein
MGDRPTTCCLVLNGLAFRYKLTSDGRRQILSFYVPGDIPDLQSLHLGIMDHHLAALSACRVAYIAHEDLSKLIRSSATLETAFWRTALVDSATFREWIVRLGGMAAPQAMAHLFCEITSRMAILGLSEGRRLLFPVVQTDLADALGITPVHVNRTLKILREQNLLTFEDGIVTICDWEGLTSLAAFDPTFLHQTRNVTIGASDNAAPPRAARTKV